MENWRVTAPMLLRLSLGFVLALFLAGSYFSLRLWFHPFPPLAVRVLPAQDTLVYLNLDRWRRANWATDLPPKAPAYNAFVRDSGFDFERDLDAAALSLDGPPLAPRQATLVLDGRFGPRFDAYLAAHALDHRTLAGSTAYAFPGWARPQQRLWILRLNSHLFGLTNAAAPDPVLLGLRRRARQWWASPPTLWRQALSSSGGHSKPWSQPPAGVLAIDLLRLAGDHDLAGWSDQWRGSSLFVARVTTGLEGQLLLHAQDQALSADAALRLQAAAQQWLRQFHPTSAPAAVTPLGRSLEAALRNGLQWSRHGDTVALDLRLER